MEHIVSSIEGQPIIINLFSGEGEDLSNLSGRNKQKLKKAAGYIPIIAAGRLVKKTIDKRREKRRND